MNVLVVMEELPENIRFFLIEDPADEDLQMLQRANNTFINCDGENEATNNVVSAFSPDEYKDTCECDEGWAGKWNKCEVETPIMKQVDQIYNVGFYM